MWKLKCVRFSRIAAAICIVALFAACADWPLWDALFTRNSVAGTRGWTAGDAAFSVPLPRSDDTLWIFGDSLVTDWDLATNQRVFGPYPLSEIVFGSAVAIQPGSLWPEPDKIAFYARQPADGAVDDITRGTTGRRLAFFGHDMLGLPQEGDGLPLIWPQGAACLSCDEDDPALALSFKEVENCNPSQGPADCVALCEVSRGDPVPREECEVGVRVVNQVLARVDNPEDPLDDWQASSIATRPANVSWGTAFLETEKFVLIYGALERDGIIDAVVAASHPDDLLDMDAWWVYTNHGFRRGARLGQIEGGEPVEPAVIAEDVGALFTVDAIRRHGKTRYLLSHAHPSGDNLLFLRLSSNPFRWPALDRNSVRVDLRSRDATLDRVARDWIERGLCEPTLENGVYDESRCGITYHGLNHGHLADRDRFGLSKLLYSYIVPIGLGDGSNSADYFRPRFGNVSVDLLGPWCKPSYSPCLQGLNHEFFNQQIEGAEPAVFTFDVSAANKLILDLQTASAGFEVEARFAVEGQEVTRPCLPRKGEGRSSSFACAIRVPNRATTTWVEVRGQTASRFDLRASYDSWLGLEEIAPDHPNKGRVRRTGKALRERRAKKLRRGIRALGQKQIEMQALQEVEADR